MNDTEDFAGYTCIECGSPVKNLYKKYSDTVLKLTKCGICNNIADKYVEYDNVIIIIDLVLLRMVAYRHFLLNSEFKNFWKLSIILLLLETFSNWTLTVKDLLIKEELNDTKPYLTEANIYLEDFKFYKMFLCIMTNTFCFVLAIYSCTILYTFVTRQRTISFVTICKAVTLSSSGMFLFLPSLVWDLGIHEFHLHFVSLYTTLSQLLAYKALCNCQKIWSLLVIFSSILFKSYVADYLSTIQLSILT